ncbi:MAG: helix-turn-helix domain-containing protein, partial [Candidatus Heimdallarchaeaceae archaeon]
MSKIEILPPLLTRIGFNEVDIKVYSATLGLGKVTIGELLVVTGIDPLTLIQSVKNLEELGFLKKITGKTPSYFAMLPFLKEYIVIEKDALYSLDGVIKTLKASKEEYKEKKSAFGGSLELTGEGSVFDIHVVSGLIKQVVDAIYQNYSEYTDKTA